jgi:hypothetical protein
MANRRTPTRQGIIMERYGVDVARRVMETRGGD